MVIIRFYSIFWLGMVTTRYFSFILHLYGAIQTRSIGWMALLFQIVKHLHNKILINFFLLDLSVLLILPTSSFINFKFFFEIWKFYIFVVIPGSMGVHRYPWFQNRTINMARAEVDKHTKFFFTNLIKLKKLIFCTFHHKIWARWATKMYNTLKWPYEPKQFGE